MKKTLQGLLLISIILLLSACSKGTLPVSIGNLSFEYDSNVWKHIQNNNDNAPLEFKDSNDNVVSINVSQESTYQHPVSMISFIESLVSDNEGFQVFQEPNEITVNETTWYEYGYLYKDGPTTHKVYQRYYGKYYNVASVSYNSTAGNYEDGYNEALKLMADIKVEEVSNRENETKAKEFLVGEWDLDGKGYLVLDNDGTYQWFSDSTKDDNNKHYGTYGCDVENANMSLVEGDGFYLVLFPEGLIIKGESDTSLKNKSDFIISLKDDGSDGYPMVNISTYTLYNLNRP